MCFFSSSSYSAAFLSCSECSVRLYSVCSVTSWASFAHSSCLWFSSASWYSRYCLVHSPANSASIRHCLYGSPLRWQCFA